LGSAKSNVWSLDIYLPIRGVEVTVPTVVAQPPGNFDVALNFARKLDHFDHFFFVYSAAKDW
jgi:hypothetical protein